MMVNHPLAILVNQIKGKRVRYAVCFVLFWFVHDSVKVTFNIDANIDGPFYLYYQLENYYQNHRRYYQSRSIQQLQGQVCLPMVCMPGSHFFCRILLKVMSNWTAILCI